MKSVMRTAWTITGREESTAEHSWRLSLFAAVAMEDFPELDREKVLKMCLIHDLGELYGGDVSAALYPDQEKKYEEEYESVKKQFNLLPETISSKLLQLWQEYNAGRSNEAKFVKALDKAETIIQHNQGKNPPDFDYSFNLTYGKQYFEGDTYLQ